MFHAVNNFSPVNLKIDEELNMSTISVGWLMNQFH